MDPLEEYDALDERFSPSKSRERKEVYLGISAVFLPIAFLFQSGISGSDGLGELFLLLGLTLLALAIGIYFAIKGYDREALKVPSLALISFHLIALMYFILG